MLFNSIEFLLFLPLVTAAYFLIPQKYRQLWLLIASYYFYMCWNVKYALLILFSTVVTYISGLLMESVKCSTLEASIKLRRKKLIVFGSFFLNLAVLFFFKYANFAIDSLNALFSLLRISLNVSNFDILLPVGISFYTFQALSYTMDVYRGDIHAEKRFIHYALFVSFFPQLVAGPIERSKNLLRQLDTPQRFHYETALDGFLLILWGLFLKIVLADRIAVFVDTVYGDFAQYGGLYLIFATILFAIQIYCDFYGYSTIAMGSARILGITLTDNFQAPYLSTSITEFWRNWHISLTSWFKDYLYIPLGGSRKGKARKYLNKILVFLVSGLWHGADFSFVIWGGINGVFQVLEELLLPVKKKLTAFFRLNPQALGNRIVSGFFTFALVDFSWIFFRAGSISNAVSILRSMLTGRNFLILFDGSLFRCGLDQSNFMLLLFGICILFFSDICKKQGIVLRDVILRQDFWCRCLVICSIIMFLLIFGIYGPVYSASGFIYFQF